MEVLDVVLMFRGFEIHLDSCIVLVQLPVLVAIPNEVGIPLCSRREQWHGPFGLRNLDVLNRVKIIAYILTATKLGVDAPVDSIL